MFILGQNWQQNQMCYLFPFNTPIKYPAERSLSRSLSLTRAMTLTISDVKYASFPLSFITVFFPRQEPKPNKGPSILPTSKQPIAYSERWRKFISSVIITGNTSHPIARHAALAYSSGSQTFSEATTSNPQLLSINHE